eukprot:Gb_37186 [translate_table: standard]
MAQDEKGFHRGFSRVIYGLCENECEQELVTSLQDKRRHCHRIKDMKRKPQQFRENLNPQIEHRNEDYQKETVPWQGIRCLCSQLLDMKMASAEELHSNVYSRCSEFVR